MDQGGCIYIMANYSKTTIYIGVTTDLQRRIQEHRHREDPKSFTARYNLKYCIYYEMLPSVVEAIAREKEVKKWRREKKENLINKMNPEWKDLWYEIKEW